MNVILGLGIILLVGLFLSRLINKLKIPSITAYLVAGILLGPHVFNCLSQSLLQSSGLISSIVLSFIAFTIGQHFSREVFSSIGKRVLWISIAAAVLPWLLISVVFFTLLKQPLHLSIIFGAIAAATAPAATVMVVRQYNAKGPFTEALLGIVAIDDAWCLIIFAISVAIGEGLRCQAASSILILKAVMYAICEIIGAVILSGVIGFILHRLARYVRTQGELLTYTVGLIMLNTGLAIHWNLSVLLANMFLGAIVVNINRENIRFFNILRSLDHPLYLIFFVIAGAQLQIPLLAKLGLIGLSYLILRVVGKMTGAWLGAVISGADKVTRRFMGLGLLPQAGVALGAALVAQARFPDIGDYVLTTIVATTVIYELIGPVCTRIALVKAGETSKDDQES